MPPHRPFDASPIGMLTMPGIPMFRTGTRGNEFGNAKPDVLGRNPGTVRVVIGSTPPAARCHAVAPGRYGRSSYVGNRMPFDAS